MNRPIRVSAAKAVVGRQMSSPRSDMLGLLLNMGGLERAPHAPRRSGLDLTRSGGLVKCPGGFADVADVFVLTVYSSYV